MKKLIPPYLFLISLLLMLLLRIIFPAYIFIKNPWNYLGILIFVTGFSITYFISKSFTEKKANIQTFGKPGALITNGLYKYTRNPIYFGFLISLAGFGVLLSCLSAFIMPLIFFLAADNWYIKFEERNMEKEFGEDYLNYKNKVRRWI